MGGLGLREIIFAESFCFNSFAALQHFPAGENVGKKRDRGHENEFGRLGATTFSTTTLSMTDLMERNQP
jgi:hypothetical protein